MFFNKHLNTSQVKGTVRPVPEPKVQNVYASPQVVTLPRAKPSVPPAVRQAKVIARVLGSVHRQAHTKNVMAWQTREAEVLRELYQRRILSLRCNGANFVLTTAHPVPPSMRCPFKHSPVRKCLSTRSPLRIASRRCRIMLVRNITAF